MSAAMTLKQLVDERGIKYKFLANETGIPLNVISQMFLGKRRLLADEMISICVAAGLDLNDMRGGVKTRPAPQGGAAGMEQEVFIGEGSSLFYASMNAAAKAGLLPVKGNWHLDGNGFMKWYSVFAAALNETARKENWPFRFQVSR